MAEEKQYILRLINGHNTNAYDIYLNYKRWIGAVARTDGRSVWYVKTGKGRIKGTRSLAETMKMFDSNATFYYQIIDYRRLN